MKSSVALTLAMIFALVGGALAIPPPPPVPPQLRSVLLSMKVKLIEAKGDTVTNVTTLCEVRGRIPVYADDNDYPPHHLGAVHGCKMRWKGRELDVLIGGAMSITDGPAIWASARASVTPPDAKPGCRDICGPQPLADSSANVRISSTAKKLTFGLQPNPVSILRSNPTVWLEAEATIVDAE